MAIPAANRQRSATWAAILAVPIGLCAAALVPTYINHDAAWYLHMTGVWLDGGTLYRDVVDTNPPLIVFLSAIPVWLARLLAASVPAVFKAWVFALAVLSTLLALSPIRQAWSREPSRLLIAVVLAFALFPFVRDEFGQREHVAAILTAPFVFQACAWASGHSAAARSAAVAGAMAGLGFALKPHFLFAWVALEASLLLAGPRSRRWLRPGMLAAAVSLLIYAALVVAFVPQYFVTAREVAAVYGGLNEPASVLVRVPELRLWFAAVLALGLLRRPSRERGPALVLFAVATGFLTAAMLQFKGWGYHFYPFRVFVLVFFIAVVNTLVEVYPAAVKAVRGARTVTAAVLIVVALWSARAAAHARRSAGSGYAASLIRLLEREPRAESFALLSMRAAVTPRVRLARRPRAMDVRGGPKNESYRLARGARERPPPTRRARARKRRRSRIVTYAHGDYGACSSTSRFL